MTRPQPGSITLTPRQSAMLNTFADLSKLRARNQVSPDPDITELLSDLDYGTRWHAAAVARASKPDAPTPVVASSVSVEHASAASGVSRSAIRLALKAGRLTGRKGEDGAWHIDPDSLAAYAPKRTNPRGNRMADFKALADHMADTRDAILDAEPGTDQVIAVVHGLSLAAGSIALLAEAFDSLTAEERTHMAGGLAILRDDPDAFTHDGSADA